MKHSGHVVSLLALASLGGCIIIADGDERNIRVSANDHDRSGTVFGAEILLDSVRFRVTSNGCTDKSDFAVSVDPDGNDEYELMLDRVAPDNCRALLPEGTVIEYSFSELGLPEGAAITIANPVRRR